MREYPKIQSVFLRDPATKYKTFLDGQYAEPAFEYLSNNEWIYTEKVDGTNVRVLWNGEMVLFGGRTDSAQMPVFLMRRLQELFATPAMIACFPGMSEVHLFGEGYGAKIQKGGGNYKRDSVDFVLFDVLVGDIFLERHNVEDIAGKLSIEIVPVVGTGSLAEAVAMVQDGFDSRWGSFPAEGLVLRPAVEMMDRRGHRIITKVKHKDFPSRGGAPSVKGSVADL